MCEGCRDFCVLVSPYISFFLKVKFYCFSSFFFELLCIFLTSKSLNFEIVFDDDEGFRLKFLTDIFNPHVSTDGVPFYRLSKDSLKPVFTTLTSVMKMISGKPNPNAIAWLNKEAADLYFSNDDQKKAEYRKQVSRCVRRSVEG